MKSLHHPVPAAALAALLAACSTVPPRNAELEDARSAFQEASSHPAANLAPAELDRARQSLASAEAGWAASKNADATRERAYIARRQAQIALAAATQAGNEARIAQAGAEREQLLQSVRTREAEPARAGARSAPEQAAQARQQAATEAERAAALQQDLAGMQARSTARGLVVTLGDALFASGRAELLPGAQRSVERIGGVLRQHPERRVLVEGFTDNTGSEDAKLALSRRRAQAFAQAMLDQGIAAERIEVRAHGAAYPVADNGTAAGRQRNRRVEVLFSDAQGRLVTR